MTDVTLNPTTPVTNGAIVTAANPLPVTIIGGIVPTAIAIGIAVTGGTVFGVLWEDASGNLASGPLLSDTTGNLVLGAGPVRLTSPAAANLQLGAASVDTAPVAQKLSVQNTLAGGTSNVAGANFTIAGSQGKGTGLGGSLIFQVAPAGSTGTAVNALATALTIDSTKTATLVGTLVTGTAGGLNIGFGGLTSSFPGFGRNGTTIQVELADTSAFTFLQAKLMTSVNATTGLAAGVLAATTNATLVLYDASGQAYRVPAII